MWVLIAAFLVFIMHLGFSMVETGFTRSKNSVNIIMKNIMTISLAAIVFMIVGFSLSFGASEGGVFGNPGEFLLIKGISYDAAWPGTTVAALAFFIFQMMFAGTAATIVSGAVAERIKFIGYVIFAVVIVAFIYPIVAHWVWGGGWLAGIGMIDFAGSTVVHLVGGSAALAGVIVLGPRIGKYVNGHVNVIPGHSIPLGALGGLILWFGWFGFNPGSNLSAGPEIALIAVTTNTAAAAGAISTMIMTWLRNGKPDVAMTINGFLAGLVGITAGTAAVSPASAALIGAVAGVLVVYAVEFFDRIARLDDPVGAISVHGICGAWGTLAVGIFGKKALGLANEGLLYGGGLTQLGIQLLGVMSVVAFVVIAMGLVFKLIDLTMGLR
ncbi:MAG: ammonium transporter, partial [Candidatus Altiarchaeota archaeon]|nr:ammonium transporter [Candidatus Altiarchaeota archaeon]